MTSWALWVPLLWIIIIGTRPISAWFGGAFDLEATDSYQDGSPLDRNIYFLLICLGLIVLSKRKVNWLEIIASNSWFFAFFLYCGISVLWSDNSFVSFKRWFKDFGNIVMVVIILTENNPLKAITGLFSRLTNLAIPLSVLIIKYFPEYGRYYLKWSWQVQFSGVTTEKNALGAIVFVCGLFLIWDLIEMRAASGAKTDKVDLLDRGVLLLMVFWLIYIVDSKTSLLCLILGTGILFLMRSPFSKKRAKFLGRYVLASGLFILLLNSYPEIFQFLPEIFGRDFELTGRIGLWRELLNSPINQLIGEGYQSFWSGSISEYYADIFYWKPNQAHNGYLQTYLDGGLIGVCLLVSMILSAGNNLKNKLLIGSRLGTLYFALYITAIVYNWTEAIFNRMSPVWFIFIMAVFKYHSLSGSLQYIVEKERDKAMGEYSD